MALDRDLSAPSHRPISRTARSQASAKPTHRKLLLRRAVRARAVDDLSGGNPAIERGYARLTHMAVARLPRRPGSATGWQNHVLRGTTAFVVELPAGPLSSHGVERFSDAILGLLG